MPYYGRGYVVVLRAYTGALVRLLRDDEAATLVEYGIVAALFTAGTVIALSAIAATAGAEYNAGAAGIQNYQTSTPP